MFPKLANFDFLKLFLIFVLIVRFSALASSDNDVNNFFPEINGNLTKITWAHAVNNQSLLEEALKSDIMMLEADVTYGNYTVTGKNIPIMGHPPQNESDLSLEVFLNKVFDYNGEKNVSKKGIKLDFKSTEVFEKSIDIINEKYDKIKFPIWINADIIEGPVKPTTNPVDAVIFLSKAEIFTNSVLSLGWTTTSPGKKVTYSNSQIDKMIQSINDQKVTQNITFAVRAGIAAESFDQMKQLKDRIDNCTLTIWSSDPNDTVDVDKLRKIIFEFGVERVFIDVPHNLYNQLNLANSGKRASIASISLLIVGIKLLF